jgi:hypothetical protein
MASTWRFYGNTLVFRLAANINTVMFNGTWEHTYDNPSEVPSISVNVTQIFLNRNFQRIILPRGDGAWHPGNVVMLEGMFTPTRAGNSVNKQLITCPKDLSAIPRVTISNSQKYDLHKAMETLLAWTMITNTRKFQAPRFSHMRRRTLPWPSKYSRKLSVEERSSGPLRRAPARMSGTSILICSCIETLRTLHTPESVSDAAVPHPLTFV